MRFLQTFVFVLLLSSFVFTQELTREDKIKKINDLRSQIGTLEKDIMLPDARDSALAAKQGVNVIRLLPREKYDGVLATRGGGSYYSFALKRQEYGTGSDDIGLERGFLNVGFAGINYGFIYDLGDVSLAEVSKDTKGASFLTAYRPPSTIPEIRSEQAKSREYEADGLVYKSHLPTAVGHTYFLRSISYGHSDLLVAFNIHRKDTDGSLIVFWKLIENFDKPDVINDNLAEK